MAETEIVRLKDLKGGMKIGVTFSAFDFIHPGHVLMLEDCKRRCDYLIVGIQVDPANNKDASYRDETGQKNKPIYTLDERVVMIKSIKYIDAYFTYETEVDLLDFLKNNDWDVRIIGSDWEGKKFTGCDLNKGQIYFHKREHNYSSTEFKRRLLERGNLVFKNK